VPLAERVDRFKMNRAKGKLKHMLEEYGQRGKLQVCCTAQDAIYVCKYKYLCLQLYIYIYMCYTVKAAIYVYICIYIFVYV